MRELEFSKMTLRLVNKENPKDSSEDNTVAKLTGDTLSTLQRILVSSIIGRVRHPPLTCVCAVHSYRACPSLKRR